MLSPTQSVTVLKGVGPKLADTLEKLGISRLMDLLLHLPYRYQDRTKITALSDVISGETYLVEGQVMGCQVVFGKRRSLKVAVSDGVKTVYLRFFYFSRYQQDALAKAKYVRAYGEFRFFGKELSVAHPEYTTFTEEPDELTAELTPIYPATQGLGQAKIRALVQQLCDQDWPEDAGLPYQKLVFLHQPPASATSEEIEAVQEELAFEELTAFFLVMKGRALQRQSAHAPELPQQEGLGRALLSNLGFRLTEAQGRVTSEVLNDLALNRPMLRLVQGDVGSGKTIIGAFAAVRSAENGYQTAVMAPTELLAEQHFINFEAWLKPLGLCVRLLTGGMAAAEQRAVRAEISDGSAHIVIGTHALFQDSVSFARLGLSIIDEQHRFGVHQRMALQQKSAEMVPHQLIMTATPIPRTLTMALYADMDVSVIDELPAGRQPITTYTVDEERREEVIDQVRLAIKSGQQAYWVCTLIEDSDELDATSATTMLTILTEALPTARVALLHGRMTSAEKIDIMHQFKAGKLDVLVATTVIEVGVDVPNATHMVMENAERLGLAQLHQLRGRIGRGSLASSCFLLFSSPLSVAARTRLNAMRDSQDGFYLAEEDLKLRGPGDILGTRQSGEQSFRVADLGLHAHLLPQVLAQGERLMGSNDAEDQERLGNLLNIWVGPDSPHLSV